MCECALATGEELSAASTAYRQQVAFGYTPESALVAATIAYLQRNPRVPAATARARIADAIGISNL